MVLLGRELRVEASRTPTDDPDLDRIDIAVTDLAAATSYRGFVGFVGRTSAP